MDPFFNTSNSLGEPATNVNSLNSTGGELYLDLGNISEDVLRDGRKAFENGLPTSATDQSAATDETPWGVVPATQSVVNAFAITETNSNSFQDVGMDGLGSPGLAIAGRNESDFFSTYLNDVAGSVTNAEALQAIQSDPSNDDYRFFRGEDSLDGQSADILTRYKRFNAPEGNSVTDEDSPEEYPTQQTTYPPRRTSTRTRTWARARATSNTAFRCARRIWWWGRGSSPTASWPRRTHPRGPSRCTGTSSKCPCVSLPRW
jgi:cell surface protein SprA